MIDINNDAILSLQDPIEIKNILLDTSNPTLYNPFSFVTELLIIIQRCFVEPEMTRFSQIMPRSDKAYMLEEMRK